MESVLNRAVKHERRLPLSKLAAYLGVSLGTMILAFKIFIFIFGATILNRYVKGKGERAFSEANPGWVLRIGKLDYAVGANCLIAKSVALEATNTTLRVEQISLKGVRWARLFWGALPADAFAKTSVEAKNLSAEFLQSQYGIRCARLSASVPASELIAEDSEMRPLMEDEAFFASHPYRTPRFHVLLPECRVAGLGYNELFLGKSYQAQRVHFSRPAFEALINRDKEPKPFETSPMMLAQALTAIAPPLKIERLTLSDGSLKYCERLAIGAEPGVLTIQEISLIVDGIANHSAPSAAIQLKGQGKLMDDGVMTVLMSIPIAATNLSLHYSGSLGPMNLTRLGAFLEIAEHTRIRSGSAQEARFEIDVIDGQARGSVSAIYKDLEIAFLDKQTGSEKGVANRVGSFFANALKIRSANPPEGSGSRKEGEVKYTKKPDDEFQQFLWFALRTGVLDIISR